MQYLIFFCFSISFLFIRSSKWYCYCFFLTLLFLFAWVNQKGSWDYYGYLEYYNCAIAFSCERDFELSYKLISKLLSNISAEYGFQFTLVFYIFLSLLIKVKVFFKNSLAIGAAIFSYLCYSYYVHELTQIRASLAIGFCWLAYDAYVYKKNKFFSFYVATYLALGVFFHTSAIIALIAIIAYKIKTKYLVFMAYISLLIGTISSDLFYIILGWMPSEKIKLYLLSINNGVYVSPLLAYYPLLLLFTVTMLFYQNKYIYFNRWLIFSCNSCLSGVILYFLMHKLPVIPIRVLEFLSTLYPFVFAAFFCSEFRFKIVNRSIIIFLFLVLFLNLAVKNNTRLDMVYKWHNLDIRYMTDYQRQQYQIFYDK